MITDWLTYSGGGGKGKCVLNFCIQTTNLILIFYFPGKTGWSPKTGGAIRPDKCHKFYILHFNVNNIYLILPQPPLFHCRFLLSMHFCNRKTCNICPYQQLLKICNVAQVDQKCSMMHCSSKTETFQYIFFTSLGVINLCHQQKTSSCWCCSRYTFIPSAMLVKTISVCFQMIFGSQEPLIHPSYCYEHW